MLPFQSVAATVMSLGQVICNGTVTLKQHFGGADHSRIQDRPPSVLTSV
jgi:hypothetical protein